MEVRLTDICDIQYGYAFDSALFSGTEGIPLVRIRDVVRGFSETRTTETFPEEYTVRDGDILIGMDGEFNISHWHGGTAALNQRVCRLIPKKVDADYIYYYMPSALNAIEDKTPYVTVKHLSAKELNKIMVPIPLPEEQVRIGKILNLVSRIIEIRRKQLRYFDNLIKARFVEMFGDPVRNEKGWEKKSLKDVCSKLNDGTHFSPESFETGDYKYITAKNIKSDGFDFTNITYVSEDVHRPIFERCNPEFGDVLYIKDGVTTGIAMVNTLEEEFSLLSSVALLKQNRDIINGHFLCGVLNNNEMYSSIRSNMGGAAITRLTIVKLNEIQIIVPPFDLQNNYAEYVKQVVEAKVAVQKALDKAQLLFDSLMQQYFG